MHETAMNVRLVQCTPLCDAAVALGGKMCYSDADLDDMIQGVIDKDNSAMIRRIINSGHESVLEHVSLRSPLVGFHGHFLHKLHGIAWQVSVYGVSGM